MTEVAATSFETSTEIGAWAEAFPAAQAAMGEVVKNRKNPAFKSQYADLAAVIEAVLPPLNAGGFSVLQPVSVDGEGQVVVSTLVMHKSGQWLKSTLRLRPVKSDPQGVGSATTYARRYGLMALAGVAPEDDDGNAASGPGKDDQRDEEPSRQPPRGRKAADDAAEASAFISRVEEWLANCTSPDQVAALFQTYKDQRDSAGISVDQDATITAAFRVRKQSLATRPEAVAA